MFDNKGNGHKNDEGKARWDLIDLDFVQEGVDVLTFGAEQYGENNWQEVENAENRYFAALMRHIVAYRNGETHDLDSGVSHLAHAFCNLMFLRHFEKLNEDGVEQ